MSFSGPAPTAPLTTIYTAPASCPTDQALVEFFPESTGTLSYSQKVARDCMVPGDPTFGASREWTVWSPGVCPSGWIGYTPTSQGPAQTRFCCPSPLVWVTSHRSDGICAFPNRGKWEWAYGSHVGGALPVQVQWTSSDLDIFTPKSAPLMARYAASTYIAGQSATRTSSSSIVAASHRATPAQSIETHPSTTKTASTGHTSTRHISAGHISTAKSSPHVPTSGLSTAVKAGIGVGAGFAFFAALSFIILFLMLKRRQKSVSKQTVDSQPQHEPKSNWEIYERAESDSHPIYEVHSNHKPPEADSTVRVELDGGWQGFENGRL